jgi:hypothetical protein
MRQFLNGRVADRRRLASSSGAKRGRSRYRRHFRCQCRTGEQIEVSVRKRGRISVRAGDRSERRSIRRSGNGGRRRRPAGATTLAWASVGGVGVEQQQRAGERGSKRGRDARQRRHPWRRLEQRSAVRALLAGRRPRPRRAQRGSQPSWPGQDGKQPAAQQQQQVARARAGGQSPRRRLRWRAQRPPGGRRQGRRRRSGGGLHAVLRQAASRERSLAVRTQRGSPTAVLQRRRHSRGRFCGRVGHPDGWRVLHD